jgi:hypothetical protein
MLVPPDGLPRMLGTHQQYDNSLGIEYLLLDGAPVPIPNPTESV